MKIANRVKGMREQAGLSQVDLAQIVGVDVNTIWRWENGRSSPTRSIQKLAQALNTTTGYLLGETDDVSASVEKPSGLSRPENRHDDTEREKIVFEQGEGPERIRLELPPTPATYAFLERQLKGLLSVGESLPRPSQEDAGERSA